MQNTISNKCRSLQKISILNDFWRIIKCLTNRYCHTYPSLLNHSTLRQLFCITSFIKCYLNRQMINYLIKHALICIYFQNRNLNVRWNQSQRFLQRGCFGNNSEITVNSQGKKIITMIWNKMLIEIRQIKNILNMNKPWIFLNIERNKTVKFSEWVKISEHSIWENDI